MKGWLKFRENMSIVVRDGRRTSFWHDNWRGKEKLSIGRGCIDGRREWGGFWNIQFNRQA